LANEIATQIKRFPYVQLIIVDDHSEDESTSNLSLNHAQIHLLNNKGIGKKSALQTGIEYSVADWIITLDADVWIEEEWFNTLLPILRDDVDLLILPLVMKKEKGFLAYFQWLEFSILQSITRGSAHREKPLLCNGAHLAFRRNEWLDIQEQYQHQHLSSGDDQFLLQAFRMRAKKIKYCDSLKGKVQIEPVNSWKALLEQRRRWSGTTRSYRLWDMKALGIITLLSNISVLILYGHLILSGPSLLVISLLAVYFVIEFTWTERKAKSSPLSTIFFLLFYPFYTVITILSFVFFKTQWKGRDVVA
jgi:cellulose synthase/poly-beta-1,6-N-acetylglucosamine synthase-like glycosyltransferase